MNGQIPQSARPADPELVRTIGPELIEARREKVPWKVLMRRFHLGKTKLWEILSAAAAETEKNNKCVRGHLDAGHTSAASFLTGS